MIRAIILCVLLIITGCGELEYDWDTRNIIEGKVTNAEGEPLEGITVSFYVSTDIGILGPWGTSSDDAEVISSTTTNSNGEYTLMFPRPENAPHMQLLINKSADGQVIDQEYSAVIKYNILDKNFIDYKIDFGTQQLLNPAGATTLTIEYVDVENIGINPGSINITGLVSPAYNDVNFEMYNPRSPYSNGEVLQVAKNQVLIFRYQKLTAENPDGTYAVELTQIPIAIHDDPVTFIFEY